MRRRVLLLFTAALALAPAAAQRVRYIDPQDIAEARREDPQVIQELGGAEARVLAHAAFGLMNSTPFLSGEVDRRRCADLLRAATLAALTGPVGRPD